LELKIKLCEAVERLADEPDVISAFNQLQKLHQEFREIGPVTRDLRNEIWNRFKMASTAVNRRHQQHFDQLKEAEQQNLDQKTVICEIVEAVEYANLTSFAAWEDKTREVIALQNKWKTIGFAPQKMNVKIFERFRKACDEFFSKKGEFFRGIKEGMSENLKKKEALCEKAEALKDSTDWKETSDMLIKLQKEWKTIGSVSRKHSDAVWKRFITACDYFFEQKGKIMLSLHSEEAENLTLKKAIINRLATMDESASSKENEEEIRKLIKEWGTIGHVPFREKDKLYKEFNGLVDKHYERLHISVSDKKLYNFKSSLSNLQETSQFLYKEREKLVRTHDRIRNDIQVYENNLGFFTSSSKKGESLLVEANRKIEKLKDDLDLISQKIKAIDERIEKES
jgi:predicted transcriptional regulator